MSKSSTVVLTTLCGSDYAVFIDQVEDMIETKGSMSKWLQGTRWPQQSEFNNTKWHGCRSYCRGRFTKQGRRVRERRDPRINYIY